MKRSYVIVVLIGFLSVIIVFLTVSTLKKQTTIKQHAASSPCTTIDLYNPCRPLLGGYVANYPQVASDTKSQILYHEQRIGRQLDIVHTYHPTGSNTLSATDIYFANRPNTYLSTTWKPSATNQWSKADGSDPVTNAGIDSMADSIKSLGAKKIFLSLAHEPENDVINDGANCTNLTYKGSSGTPTEYRAMWKNVEKRFRDKGVTNVIWVMNYMGFSYWNCLVDDLWPGDATTRVDWIFFDPYTNSDGTSWARTAGDFYKTLSNDKLHNFTSLPWGLGEFGSGGTSSQAHAYQYYQDIKKSLDNHTYPNIKAYNVFDSDGHSKTRVEYSPDGVFDAQEQKEYNALANDPLLLSGTTTTSPPPPSPSSPPSPALSQPPLGDTTPPSVPTNVKATGVSASQINLSWNQSTDNVSVTGYKIFRDGSLLTTTSSTIPFYQDTGLASGSTHTYTVSAGDAAGNTSTKSSQVSGTTQNPTTPQTTLQFAILFDGIGSAGDQTNPTGGGGNFNPVHLQRTLTVEILDGNEKVIASNKNGQVFFNPQNGDFTGRIPITGLKTSGTYGVQIKLSQSLKKLKLLTITLGTNNIVPQLTLVNGDVNNDGFVSINIIDYNILLGCYSDFTSPIDCDSARKLQADINDDGHVDLLDFNLFLRELRTVGGN